MIATAIAAKGGLSYAVGGVSAATASDDFALAPNQTFGFGADQLLRFTYAQEGRCVNRSEGDPRRNLVETPAEAEMDRTPTRRVADESFPDRAGVVVERSEPLYVLVPMFSLNGDQSPDDAFTPALGQQLIKLLGAVPEAFKTHPLVAVECPNSGDPGRGCTMHMSQIDLHPALVALGKIPHTPQHSIFMPTPNHTHIIDDDAIDTDPIWWQVIAVLVTSPSAWPNAAGTSGITSKAKLLDAEQRGEAVETGTNLFLLFASELLAPLSH